MDENIQILKDNTKAVINPTNGQLFSISFNGEEFMHDGKTDWSNSEIPMFPIIGEVANFQILIKDKQGAVEKYSQDKHGIARNIPFIIKEQNPERVQLMQYYHGTNVVNPKAGSGKENPANLRWLSYRLKKDIGVFSNGVNIDFKLINTSDQQMPYMFGWHPAFKRLGKVEECVFETANKVFSALPLEKVIEASKVGAVIISEPLSINYYNKNTNKGLTLTLGGKFRDAMLWTPSYNANMVCIEPITTSPIPSERERIFQRDISIGNDHLKPGEITFFQTWIAPYQKRH